MYHQFVDFEVRAKQILQQAESALGQLLNEASNSRDWTRVDWLLRLIKSVASLEASGNIGSVKSQMQLDHPEDAGRASSIIAQAYQKPQLKKVGTREYPIFKREGADTLVKVGYSKSDRRQYEHRSPRTVLERLSEQIGKVGSDGAVFTSDQLLPPGEQTLADLPTYQVYLCLAFLVQHGVVHKLGRQGYSIAPESAGDIRAAASNAFEKLGR